MSKLFSGKVGGGLGLFNSGRCYCTNPVPKPSNINVRNEKKMPTLTTG